MKRFSDRVEKLLIRTAILALVVLVLVQGMMTRDPLRLYLSWGERLEGQSIEYPASTQPPEREQDTSNIQSPYALVTISADKYSSLPRAIILVNGQEKTRFETEKVELKLMAGDVVEIDSTSYNFPVDYKIEEISNNLAYPEKGQIYSSDQSIVMIGKVVVK